MRESYHYRTSRPAPSLSVGFFFLAAVIYFQEGKQQETYRLPTLFVSLTDSLYSPPYRLSLLLQESLTDSLYSFKRVGKRYERTKAKRGRKPIIICGGKYFFYIDRYVRRNSDLSANERIETFFFLFRSATRTRECAALSY